jgi:hypothetical protein
VSSPSPLAIGLIVGAVPVTIGAVYQIVGYFARRFLTQQAENHKDTLEVVRSVHQIQNELPKLGFRISRLEVTALVGAATAAYFAWRQRPPGSV